MCSSAKWYNDPDDWEYYSNATWSPRIFLLCSASHRRQLRFRTFQNLLTKKKNNSVLYKRLIGDALGRYVYHRNVNDQHMHGPAARNDLTWTWPIHWFGFCHGKKKLVWWVWKMFPAVAAAEHTPVQQSYIIDVKWFHNWPTHLIITYIAIHIYEQRRVILLYTRMNAVLGYRWLHIQGEVSGSALIPSLWTMEIYNSMVLLMCSSGWRSFHAELTVSWVSELWIAFVCIHFEDDLQNLTEHTNTTIIILLSSREPHPLCSTIINW